MQKFFEKFKEELEAFLKIFEKNIEPLEKFLKELFTLDFQKKKIIVIMFGIRKRFSEKKIQGKFLMPGRFS